MASNSPAQLDDSKLDAPSPEADNESTPIHSDSNVTKVDKATYNMIAELVRTIGEVQKE